MPTRFLRITYSNRISLAELSVVPGRYYHPTRAARAGDPGLLPVLIEDPVVL
jgi:hypothetical protein